MIKVKVKTRESLIDDSEESLTQRLLLAEKKLRYLTELTPSQEKRIIHRAWVRELGIKYSTDYNVKIEDKFDRVDISPKENNFWRICVIGLEEKFFDATLIKLGTSGESENPQVNFRNASEEKIISHIELLLNLIKIL